MGMKIRIALVAALVAPMFHSSLATAQSGPYAPIQGRWGMVRSAGGGSPIEIDEYAEGERQQILIAADRIEVWGPQPWGEPLTERLVIPVTWSGWDVRLDLDPDTVFYPFTSGCNPIKAILVTQAYYDPYYISCEAPPCLVLSLNYTCPDAGDYMYTRWAVVKSSPSSFGRVKALYE